jgi:hypothetical protein
MIENTIMSCKEPKNMLDNLGVNFIAKNRAKINTEGVNARDTSK